MPTLISVHNSKGEVGRCDAKCYEAEHPDCDCVCNGKNHGKGLRQAQINTQKITEEILERFSGQKVVFNDQQLELF